MENKISKKQIAVLKRKATILKKRELKEKKQMQNESKKLLNAGFMFTNEKNNVNDKFKVTDDIKAERQRKKYERRIDTVENAINNMYHTRTINDVYAMNLIFKPENSEELIIAPHETLIKNRLTNIFINEITTNNKNLKISQFVTIKYLIHDGEPVIENDYLDMLDSKAYNKDEYKEVYFNSGITVLTSIKRVEAIVNDIINAFRNEVEQMNNRGSGGVFAGIIKTEVKMSKSKNIFGGSYVELPEKIKNKQACVNIKNDDNECFKWSLLAFKHYDEIKSKSKNEVRHYTKYVDSIKLPEYVSYPVETQAIGMWEQANNMKINVFVLDESDNIKIEYH